MITLNLPIATEISTVLNQIIIFDGAHNHNRSLVQDDKDNKLRYVWHFKTSLKYDTSSSINCYILPIMPVLCLKLACYASIMLNALAYLLCLKLCWNN